jgi:hypothetical protein
MEKLIEAKFREQKRYSFDEFCRAFGEIESDKVRRIISRLKAREVLKQVKDKKEKDLSELSTEDLSEESLFSEGNKFFVFTFVGVLWIEGCIIKCYPKYNDPQGDKDYDEEDLTCVFKVLRKFSQKDSRRKLSDVVHLYNDFAEDQSFNILSVMLYFLSD